MPVVFVGFVSADAESSCACFEGGGGYGAVAFSVDVEGDVSFYGVADDGDVLPSSALEGSVVGAVVVASDEVVVVVACVACDGWCLDACVECDASCPGVVFLCYDDFVAEVGSVLRVS